jgi:hypothetical protein
VQVTGFDPVHMPFWQTFVWLHLFVPVHAVPFAATGLLQMPVVVLHVPAVWHESIAEQTTGFDGVHVPA